MNVERLLPTDEARDLLALTREICADKLAPRASADEEAEAFPRDVFRLLGEAGLLSLAFPEEYGGGEQPYEVYLQALEEIARAWMSVGVGVSVHSLASSAVAAYGTAEQRDGWLPDMLGGTQLGAYCLSEPQAGSDVSGIRTKAVRDGDSFVVNGVKAWISHGGHADFYLLFARTSDDPRRGLSAFHVPTGLAGLSFGPPEKKMGLTGSSTTQVIFEDVRLSADRLVGAEGDGMKIALSALDSGRLGIAACAVGLGQAALDEATRYATERQQFGQTIGGFQGVQFLLADMASAVESARATYLHAARLRDAGRRFSRQASIAKLVATDAA
nr:acyl-CoA dehydrogenase family protein [Actinomycetota bacterium]